MTWVWIFIRVVLSVIVIVGAAIYFFQERVIFYPYKTVADFKYNFKNRAEEKVLKIEKDDIHSLYFEAPQAPGVVIYFHGNAGSLEDWGALASEFVDETGWNIWMVDYPGYGKSTGAITSEGILHQVADLVFEEAMKLNPGKKIVIFGRSLGSGIASNLATKKSIQGLILETPFYNVTAMARKIFPYVPGFLIRYKLASNESLKDIKVPLLVLHGTSDQIVPFEQGKRLYDEFQGDKRFIQINGGGHNNLDESPLFWQGIRAFLRAL